MKIIDPHVHLWDRQYPWHEWLNLNETQLFGSLKAIQSNYVLDDYFADTKAYEIDAFVHIEAVSSRYAMEELNWLTTLSRQTKKLKGIVSSLNLTDPKAEAKMAAYAAHPLVKGVRHIVNWSDEPQYRMCDRADYLWDQIWRENFSRLAQYDLSFDLHLCPEQMQTMADIIEASPETRVVIDHAGFPIPSDQARWQAGMARLAQCPQVFVKLSGFGLLNHHWSADSVRPIMTFLIEHFGVERSMFASNFPVDKLYSSYDYLIEQYALALEHYSMPDKRQIFYETAKRFYRLDMA